MPPDADGPAASSDRPEYVVVARRYRPQTFTELVGQNQVAQALTTAIKTHRVGHAYLFTGARGVGKTSTARIFAKALNCVQGPTTEPCNECDVCQAIAAGEDIDVLEIDGASNRGIDEIRQLRSNVSIHPSRSRFKIYIIDEVHMLTLQAFNALLKTLEEPPEHVKFIFCTTEADKIPITIRSRCQRYDFPPVECQSIVERLRYIVEKEGAAAEDEALALLARRANGSLRDSQSLLEQLLSFAPTRISVDDVHAMLGTARGGQVATLAQRLAERDAAGALKEVDTALTEGVDAGQLTEQLVGYFRDMLAATVGCDPDLLLQANPADHLQLQQAGQSFGVETLLAVVQILDQAAARMRYSAHVRVLLELAIVRICRLEALDDVAELVTQIRQGNVPATTAASAGTREKKNESLRDALTAATAAPSRAATGPTLPVPSLPRRREASSGPSAQQAIPPASPPASSGDWRAEQDPVAGRRESGSDPGETAGESESAVASSPHSEDLSPPAVEAVWREALADLGDMTADFARQAEAVQFTPPNRLVATFRPAYSLHKEQCERPERRTKLEAALAKAIGRPVRLDLELLPATAHSEPRPVPVPTNRQRLQERQRQPLVRQALEMFDGEVLRVDEPRASGEERS